MSEDGGRSAAGPEVDGRRRDRLEAELREMAPYYTGAWSPGEGDVGTTLLTLFAELAEEVTERLDQVPEKHRISFFDTLGFSRKPPQPARLPLSLEVADRAGGNVTVPPGTQATATGTDGTDRLFEVPDGAGFDATPANLRTVYSVDPDDDAIYRHDDAPRGGDETAALFGPEAGENLQEHVLYLGDANRLSVGAGSSLRLELETGADRSLLEGALRWEYYGERAVGETTVTGWHPFPSQVDFASLVDGASAEALAELLAEHGYTVDQLRAHAPDLVERRFPSLARGRSADAGADGSGEDGGPVVLTFEPDGTLAPTEVDGVESQWIRCRVPPDTGPTTRRALFDLSLDAGGDSPAYEPPIRVGAGADSLAPEQLLRNDVPLEPAPIRPFGARPREGDAFYVASTDALTKPGATVSLRFREPSDLRPGRRVVDREDHSPDTAVVVARVEETADDWVVFQDETVAYQNQRYGYGPDEPVVLVAFEDELAGGWSDWERADPSALFAEVLDRGIKFHAFPAARLESVDGSDEPAVHSPELSWEYFDGAGWSSLAGDGREVDDGTAGLQRPGTVEITVPDDLAATTVAGHEDHWIRARLVGGDYGSLKTEEIPNTDPTRFRQVEAFDAPVFESVRLEYSQVAGPAHARTANNLAFGRDAVDDRLESYRPFERLPTDDQALYLGFDAPLTDGPINLLFDLADVAYPTAFTPRVRWEYYDADVGAWQRLDVRDGTDGLTERGIVSLVFPEATTSRPAFGEDRHWVRARVTGEPFGTVGDADGDDAAERRPEGACGRFVETVPPAGETGRHRPPLRAIYPNAVWVRDRRTIEGEVLGSSDGSVGQTFAVGSPPVVSAEVWVDELAVLSAASREALREERPDRTELETDADGQPTAFWVRWDRQADLLDSGADDRHYTLDPIDGTVSFGDGTRGKIPPRGADNVLANYETGGGEAGNVPAGAVSGFRQSLAFVESVTNPIAGAAGADDEATAAVTDRAARELRDRNRAVAPADFERLAGEASRDVARAHCLPGLDPDGRYQPGWVTLLVVPEAAAAKPTPSTTLRETVEAALADHAPATLLAADQLVVRGPSYVSVSVDAELAAAGGSISRLEERAREAVRSYLHPLTGGPDGEGWAFGALPCRSDFFELLEGLDGVDHVERLVLRFETDRTRIAVAEGDDDPDTTADALACAGDQDVTATLIDGGRSA